MSRIYGWISSASSWLSRPLLYPLAIYASPPDVLACTLNPLTRLPAGFGGLARSCGVVGMENVETNLWFLAGTMGHWPLPWLLSQLLLIISIKPANVVGTYNIYVTVLTSILVFYLIFFCSLDFVANLLPLNILLLNVLFLDFNLYLNYWAPGTPFFKKPQMNHFAPFLGQSGSPCF